MWMPGKMTTRWNFGSGLMADTFSPRPVTRHVPPVKKKGTSEPIRAASDLNLLKGKRLKSHNLRSAVKVTAAFDDPPPSPAPEGIFLYSLMVAPKVRVGRGELW